MKVKDTKERKPSRHNRTHAHTNSQRPWQQTQVRWRPSVERGVDTKSPSITQSYLQMITACKGNISFLKWSITRYTNHTWGQTSCPAVGDQHKKELNGTFGGFFFLVLYCFVWAFKKILTCRSFAVYDGFWFCIFVAFLCFLCFFLWLF